MKQTDQAAFVNSIKAGDIGLILGRNLFATLQNLYRLRFKEGPFEASHGFYVRNPPQITEANGLFVSQATFLKNIGDSTKAWFFRYRNLTPVQLQVMNDYVDGMVDAGGHYSMGGIVQFGLQFFGIRKKVHEEGGMFCTELTGKTILKGGLPYITDRPAFAVTPSYQLNWLLATAPKFAWDLGAYYDGAGKYFLSEQEDINGSNTKSANVA